MKFDIRSFTASFTLTVTIFSLLLFTWCSINGFGAQIVQIFESVHPSGGFSIIDNFDANLISKIPGIIINTLYAAIDSFIFSLLIAIFNNFFLNKLKK